MAIRIVCPHCDADFNVNDNMIGKQVRCKSCEEPFKAREPDDTGSKKSAAVKAAANGKSKPAKSDKVSSSRTKSAPVDEDRPRRKRDDDDDDDRKPRKSRAADDDADDDDDRSSRKSKPGKKKGAPMGLIIGISAGVLVLLIGGVVLMICLMGGEDADIAEIRRTQGDAAADLAKQLKQAAKQMGADLGKNPGNIPDMGKMADLANDLAKDMGKNPGKFPDPGKMPDPAKIFGGDNNKDATSPTEALTLLKSPDNNTKNRGIRYLVKTEPNGAEQAEIAKQLESLQGASGVYNVDNALAKWATKDQVPALIKIIQKTPFGPGNELRKDCLLALGRLQDERGLDIIVERIGDNWDSEGAGQALDKFPETIKPALLKHAFHKHGEVRKHVQTVLQRLNATPDDMLPAAVTALSSPENDVKQAALEYITKTPVVPAQQAAVSKALEGLLNDQGKRVDAAKAMLNWATKENMPALINVWGQQGAPHNELRQIFVRLKDERGAELIAKQMTDFFQREGAFNSLKQMGGEAASKYVVTLVTHPDRWVSDRAKQLMQEWGGKADDFLAQALKDLQSPDNGKRQAALDLLLKSAPVDAMRAQVSTAVQPLTTDPDGGTADRANRVVLHWAGKDSIPTLIKMAIDEQGRYRHPAMDALAKFPDVPDAMKTIASRLLHGGDRGHARKVLEQIGRPAEAAVHAAMLSTQDRGLLTDCCHILARIGTKQSGQILQKVMLVANQHKDRGLLTAAQQAFAACQGR